MAANTKQHLQHSAAPPQVAPDSSRMMRLEVTQLRPYDRNPRRCPNNEYERIKASIRTQGLDQPLVVTQRPGDSDYMLMAGGNTRLRAMLALYDETNEEAFGHIDCLFKPWVGESDVLLSHLRENELRDNLFFIDKALAVCEAKALLESEQKGRPLSQRRLSESITQRGLSFSQTLISRMVYAVQTLWPLIPQALSAGMGSPQVARIQGLERAARAIWSCKALGSDEEFDQTFAALCRRYDSPDWVTDVLCGALEIEIAEAAEADLALIRLELEAQIAGKPLPAVDLNPETPERSPGLDITTAPSETSGSAVNECAVDHTVVLACSSETRVDSPDDCVPPPATQKPNALDRLRQRAYELATRLAHAYGLGHLIQPLPDQGLGFVLLDVPDAALLDVLDEDLQQQAIAVWWQLAACAETTVAPAALMATQLRQGTALQQAVADQNARELFAAVAPLEPGLIGDQLWRRLSDHDWKILLALTDTYRALHRLARESGEPLWQE